MINSWADCRDYIAADHFSRGGSGRLAREFLLHPVARFSVLMRLVEWQANNGTPLLLRLPLLLWFRRLSLRLGFSISPNVFGPGVAISHYGNIAVHPDAHVGRNCRIHIGTTIAGSAVIMDAADVPEHDAPIIGDNVYIGPGAKMYGPITIADNCVIGANAVVTQSVERPGVTVAGIPARIVAEAGSQGMLIRGCDRITALSSDALTR